MRNAFIATLALTLLAGSTSGTLAAGTPQQKCIGAKLKAAGKKLAGKMSCHAKAKIVGLSVDPSCLAKAEAKFSATVTKAGGLCAGTPATLESPVDDCVNNLLPDIPGNGKCPGTSAKAAGKAGSGLLACRVKEITKPGTSVVCDGGVDNKLLSALAKAGACADGSNLKATLHGCLDAIDMVAEPPTTTTSTSSSTSSTTSTTLPCQAVVGGFCWYLGADGADCNATCAVAGRAYDSATATYAGSGGTDANCLDVGTALVPGAEFIGAGPGIGIGCWKVAGFPDFVRETVPTTAAASESGSLRVCACQ